MAKAGCQSVAMIDFDHVSVAALSARNGHLASRRCPHWLANLATQIDAGVDCKTSQDRVRSHAEWRSHLRFAGDRWAHRNRDQRPAVAVDLLASQIDAIQLGLEGAVV